jgi:hypothetical protein
MAATARARLTSAERFERLEQLSPTTPTPMVARSGVE